MKKILLFITLIAGLLLTSCNKDNPNSDSGQTPEETIDIDLTETSYWKGTVGNEEFFICVELLTEEGKEDLYNKWIDTPLDDKYTNIISAVIRNTGNNALDISYGLVSKSQNGFSAEYFDYMPLPRTFTATVNGLSSSYNDKEFSLTKLSKDEFDDGIKTEAAENSYWESEKDSEGTYYSLTIKKDSNAPNAYMAPFSIDIFKNSFEIKRTTFYDNGGLSILILSYDGYMIGNTIFISNGLELTLFTIYGNKITGAYDGRTITMTKTEQQSATM